MRNRWLSIACLLVASTADAATPSVIAIDDVAAHYVRPHRRVVVEPGRRMNLLCLGEGSPTVVFDSGLSDWSSTWALIQPAVATRTRACSYDRAGMGYSDASTRPRTPRRLVAELHALLAGARVDGPLVLVGHSLGGFNMKLYAVTYPRDVAGVVLVDPSEERLAARVGAAMTARFGADAVRRWIADDRAGIDELVAHFRDCAHQARAGTLDDAAYAACSDPPRAPLGDAILAERRRLQPRADYMATQYREIAASPFVPDADADAGYAQRFGGERPLADKPLVVLTHSQWEMTPPFGEIGYASWLAAHRLTASLSSRGVQRMVPMSRHNIQVDQPQAVIDAIVEVLDAIDAPR